MEKVHTIKPLTHGLPKTGDILTSYDNDDGDTQRGWWLGRTAANNKNRFVEKELVSGEFVILDKATGLMWVKDLTGAGCNNGNTLKWSDAAAFVAALDFGGFTDWFVPNFFELISLFNGGASYPCVYDTIFNNWSPAFGIWSSSNRPLTPLRKIFIDFSFQTDVSSATDVLTINILPCRVI